MYCLLQQGDSSAQSEGNSNMMEICDIPPVVFSCGYWYYYRLGRSKMEILEFCPSSLHHWIIMNVSLSELNRYFLPKWSHFWWAQTHLEEMERYRGRVPLRSRAHDPQAAVGRGDPPAPAGLKRRKGTGYFLWKHTSEGIQKLPSVQPQVVPVQQTPPAYSNVPSPAVLQNSERWAPTWTFPPAADGDAVAPAYLLSVVSSPVPFFSGSCSEGILFFSRLVMLPCHHLSAEEMCPAGQKHSTDKLLAVFPRHIGSIHGGMREQN